MWVGGRCTRYCLPAELPLLVKEFKKKVTYIYKPDGVGAGAASANTSPDSTVSVLLTRLDRSRDRFAPLHQGCQGDGIFLLKDPNDVVRRPRNNAVVQGACVGAGWATFPLALKLGVHLTALLVPCARVHITPTSDEPAQV